MSPASNTEPLIVEGHYVEVEKTVADLLKEPPVKVTIDGKTIQIARTTLVENPVNQVENVGASGGGIVHRVPGQAPEAEKQLASRERQRPELRRSSGRSRSRLAR